MKCPACGNVANKVIDSRLLANQESIRRRRECEACARRFTTYERVEVDLPAIVKKDGRREPFDALKLKTGLERACQKRPVPLAMLDAIVSNIERDLSDLGEREVASSLIGEKVMTHLREVDQVAYVRFASVYRSFDDIGEFLTELQRLTKRVRPLGQALLGGLASLPRPLDVPTTTPLEVHADRPSSEPVGDPSDGAGGGDGQTPR